MNQEHLPYVSYMLRLWLENDERYSAESRAEGEWRASLEDPRTEEMQIFADLEALFHFILGETKRRASSEDARLEGTDDGN